MDPAYLVRAAQQGDETDALRCCLCRNGIVPCFAARLPSIESLETVIPDALVGIQLLLAWFSKQTFLDSLADRSVQPVANLAGLRHLTGTGGQRRGKQ